MTETATHTHRSVPPEEDPQHGVIFLLYVKRDATVELLSEEQKPEWASLVRTESQTWDMEGQEGWFGPKLQSGVYRLILKKPGRVRWALGQEDDLVVWDGSKNPPTDPPMGERTRPDRFNDVTEKVWKEHWAAASKISGGWES